MLRIYLLTLYNKNINNDNDKNVNNNLVYESRKNSKSQQNHTVTQQ